MQAASARRVESAPFAGVVSIFICREVSLLQTYLVISGRRKHKQGRSEIIRIRLYGPEISIINYTVL